MEKVHFLRIFQNPQISFASKSTGVDQVLTKMLQIDPKLTFNVFHILNHDHISKIEKNIWWLRTPPKKAFFGGGSGGLKYKDLGYVSGRFISKRCYNQRSLTDRIISDQRCDESTKYEILFAFFNIYLAYVYTSQTLDSTCSRKSGSWRMLLI